MPEDSHVLFYPNHSKQCPESVGFVQLVPGIKLCDLQKLTDQIAPRPSHSSSTIPPSFTKPNQYNPNQIKPTK